MRALLVLLLLLAASTARADYLYAITTPGDVVKPPDMPGAKLTLKTGVVQIKNPLQSLWECWLSDGTNSYHGLLLREPFPGGLALWTARSDNDMWLKWITLWVDSDLSRKTKGPIRIYQIEKLPDTDCAAYGNATLVRVTTDAGTLRRPQETVCNSTSDAGVRSACSQRAGRWPDGGVVISCPGKKDHYLKQWLRGGSLGGPDPEPGGKDDPAKGTSAAPPPPLLGLPKDFWDVPPAPTTHTCELPIGTACP